MLKKNQNGFGVLELLLILAVLGIIGLSGWFVWHINNSKSTPVVTSPQPSQINSNQDSNNTRPTIVNLNSQASEQYEPKPLVSEFQIKEWGVKFKIAQDLSKLTYTLADNDTVGFSYSDWESKDVQCSSALGAAGYLSRYEEKSATEEIKESAEYKLGSFYYVYEGPQSPCSSNEQILNEQISTQPAINLRNSVTISLAQL